MEMVRIILCLSLVALSVKSTSELCFVLRESTTRRDAIAVAPAASQTHCNIQCIDTAGCEACMFYADRGRCVMLTAAMAPPPGQCPVAYKYYEKVTSGCPATSPPLVDRGYTSGVCSNSSYIMGPPVTGALQTCGKPATAGEKRVLDAILHDGSTRMVLENDETSFVQWNPYIGSWYYELKDQQYYFKCATCVRSPETLLDPSCGCGPLPSDQPLIPPATGIDTPSEPHTDGTTPICTNSLQLYFKRTRGLDGNDQRNVSINCKVRSNTNGISFYCAMGEWMMYYYLSGSYNEVTVLAATCIVP